MFADFGVPPSGRYTSIVIVAGMLPAANAKPVKKPFALATYGNVKSVPAASAIMLALLEEL